MSAVSNFQGAVAVRFFLGVFEAAVTPGFALFTSQWYTTKEQGTRTAIWFSFNGLGQILGGLLAYGIARGSRLHGSKIAPWKALFIATGLLTSAMGFLFLLFMPDNQLNAKWLSKRDRVLAIERVRANQQGIGNKKFKMKQLKEALTDPITWAFAFLALAGNIPNGGLTNFFSQLIVSFGYSPEQSLLYGTPGGAVEVLVLISCGWLGDRMGKRLLVGMSGMGLAILGMLLIVGLPLESRKGRLAGYYLTQGAPTPFVAVLSLISTNIAGWTKKTTVAAVFLIFYCAGNIVGTFSPCGIILGSCCYMDNNMIAMYEGPQTFRPKDAPRYVSAEITIICCWSACLVDILFIWWYFRNQNQRKAAFRRKPDYRKEENQEWLDLTDR